MGTPKKSDMESSYVREAFVSIGLQPKSIAIVHPDPPDVCVDLGDRLVGVEVTDFARDIGPTHKSGLRSDEARLEEVRRAFAEARRSFPGLSVDGSVFFRNRPGSVGGVSANCRPMLPSRRETKGFAEQQLRFAQAHEASLLRCPRQFVDFGPEFGLLAKYVERLALRQEDWQAEWDFDPRAKTHGFAKDQWLCHLNHKAERLRAAECRDPERFTAYDELWLLIVSSPAYSSQSIVATLDMFRGDRQWSEAAEASHFHTVLVHESSQPGSTWRWRRSLGWDEPRKGG